MSDAKEPSRVRIHYHRIPDRERIYDQRVVLERDDVILTLSDPLELDAPMMHDGRVMLEASSLALWFTFPGAAKPSQLKSISCKARSWTYSRLRSRRGPT